MEQKKLAKNMQKDLKKYKSLQKKNFSQYVYYRSEELRERADKYLEMFMNDELDVGEYQKIFALYIDTFANYGKEKLLDKLQAQCDFNVREHIEYSSLSAWQKIMGKKKNEIPYLSSKQLNKRAKFYVSANEKISHDWNGNISLMSKIDNLREEETRYVSAFLDGKVVIKPEDYSAFQNYIKTIEFDCYEGSPADKALQKLANLQKQNTVKPITPKKSFTERLTQLKNKVAGIFHNFGRMFKSKSANRKVATQRKLQPTNNLRRVLKYVAVGSAFLVTTLSLSNGSGNSKVNEHKAKVALKQNKATKHAIDKTDTVSFAQQVVATPVKTIVAPEKQQISLTDSLQSSYRKISKNFYDETISHFVSSAERDSMYAQVSAQVKKGIFTLPENISAERMAYSMIMYKQYGVHSSLAQAYSSKVKLSDTAQKKLVEDILAAGETGLGVKKMALNQHGKLNDYSAIKGKSISKQAKHAKNLKDLQQIRKAMARAGLSN